MVQTYRLLRIKSFKFDNFNSSHGLYVCTIFYNGLYNGLYGGMYVCTIFPNGLYGGMYVCTIFPNDLYRCM